MSKRAIFSSGNKLRITTLFELCQLITNLYPDFQTQNPYNCFKDKINLSGYFYRHHKEDIYRLYHLLVHCLTCINHIYRIQDKQGNYLSDKQDNITTLAMLQGEGFTNLILPQAVRETYKELMSYYGTETTFTAKKARFILQLSKTTFNRHLQQLQQLGYLHQSGGNKKSGYQYQLLDKLNPNQLSNPFTIDEKKAIESLFEQALPEVKTNYPI